MNKCDPIEAARFLEALCRCSDPEVTFQTFDDQKSRRPGLAQVRHGQLSNLFQELERLNQRGAGVFVMVNQGDGMLHGQSRTVRTKQNVIGIRSVFVDLDGAPIEPVLSAPAPPNIVVESSQGRFHAYWLVHDFKLEEFTPLQTELAKKYSGDPSVKDLPRVMRIPGFWHQKHAPFMTRIVQTPIHQSEA